jgi:ribosomal protein S30
MGKANGNEPVTPITPHFLWITGKDRHHEQIPRTREKMNYSRRQAVVDGWGSSVRVTETGTIRKKEKENMLDINMTV